MRGKSTARIDLDARYPFVPSILLFIGTSVNYTNLINCQGYLKRLEREDAKLSYSHFLDASMINSRLFFIVKVRLIISLLPQKKRKGKKRGSKKSKSLVSKGRCSSAQTLVAYILPFPFSPPSVGLAPKRNARKPMSQKKISRLE